MQQSIQRPLSGVFRGVAMKTLARNFTFRKNDQAQHSVCSNSTREALLRLAANSRDACALIAVYDEYGDDLKASAVRWFGRNLEVRNKAINSILAAIGRQAPTYDPESMDAAEWVRQCADAEAKKLREALDATCYQRSRPGRDA